MLNRTMVHFLSTLTWESTSDHYSTYLDRDGCAVYLEHGTCRQLVEFYDLDLNALWFTHEFRHHHDYWHSRFRVERKFRAAIMLKVIDPDTVDSALVFCPDCNDPKFQDDTTWIDSRDEAVCESCVQNYTSCDDCGELVSETWYTLHDEYVCESCQENNYRHCDECDGYYHTDRADEHEHGDGCCESPAMSFSIRNDGHEPLRNDTQVKVTLPAGVISEVGMQQIRALVWRHGREVTKALVNDEGEVVDADYDLREKWRAMSYQIDGKVGATWQTKQGNFTKRLSRFAYKEHGLKIPPEIISEVGNVASAHSREVDFLVDITRDLNQSPDEFAHPDSCWWQSYYHGRCALKTNGGFGLRTFEEGFSRSYVNGRAWVMPLKERVSCYAPFLEPTFDTEKAVAFVVFNGYGSLDGYNPARVLSHMLGMTYRRLSTFSCSPMYVNGETGYLVCSEEIAQQYTDGTLNLSVDQHSNLFHHEQAQAATVAADNTEKEIAHV